MATSATQPQTEQPRVRYRFGVFVLDPATREMRRDGELLSLSPKVFDCIVYLLTHRERAVGHDELAAAVWGKADVTDAQLRQLVRKVRRIVGGDGDHQSTIRTIAHFGFHWVADTALDTASGDAPSIEERSARPAATSGTHEEIASSHRNRRIARVALGLGLAAAAIFAFALARRPVGDGEIFPVAHPVADETSHAIAVLPTQIASNDDTDVSWMTLGLMDFVAGHLRKASVPIVATSDVVALSRNAPTGGLVERVRNATRASGVVVSSATHQQNGWRVRLALRGANDMERAAEADSPDVLVAAREASDRLLMLLGKGAPVPAPDDSEPTTAELAQHIESALLVNDYGTARRLIESAAPAVQEMPEFQLDLARIDSALDKDKAARERLTALLLKVSARDNPVLHARALTALGWIDTTDTKTALQEYSQAIDLLARTDDPVHLGAAYLGRAVAYSLARQFDNAKADYARARVMFSLANDSLHLASVDVDEAALDADFGRPADALPLFERAAATIERFGAIDELITPVCNQILVHLELLQSAKALSVYERMRPKVAAAGSQESLHFLDYLGAVSLGATGRLTASRTLAASVANASGPGEGLVGLIDGFLAELDLSDGKLDAAAAHASKSVAHLAELRRFPEAAASARLTLTRALRGAGHATEAETQTLEFATMNAKTPKIALRAQLAEAEQYWSSDRARAIEIYEAAAQAAEHGGVPYEIRVVAMSYGKALLDAGDLAEASAAIGRVGRWASQDFESAVLQTRLYRALDQNDAWQLSLGNARALAGERAIPADVQSPPPASVSLVQSQH
jgi:DNA-binding winged helix-turn-helix (wHTH) protein/tetratricopeptide (TPR) repeat protein